VIENARKPASTALLFTVGKFLIALSATRKGDPVPSTNTHASALIAMMTNGVRRVSFSSWYYGNMSSFEVTALTETARKTAAEERKQCS
jgi:hypothetical protein